MMFRIVALGDTDGNGEVNSDDLLAIQGAGKYNHPELGPATWREGDYNGDDLVNSAYLFAVLEAAKFNAGPYTVDSAVAGDGIMTATGDITLDASGAAGMSAVGASSRPAAFLTAIRPTLTPVLTS